MTDTPPNHPLLPAAQAPPPEPQAWPTDEEQPVNYRRYLAAVLRHKWLIAALTVVGTAAGFAGTRFAPSEYLAQATLWLQVGGTRQGGRETGPIQAAELLEWSSWVDLLRSFVVLDEVVRREHVYLENDDALDRPLFTGFRLKPRFVPGKYRLEVARDGRTFALTMAGQEVQRAAVGDSVGPATGFEWVPAAADLRPGRVIAFRVRTPREAALTLRDELRSILPQQGSFLRLELQGGDPIATAATLNAVAERFVEVAAQLKRQKLTELSTILAEQLNSSYADLGRAERSLEGFRVHTITLPSEQASPVTPGLEQTRDPVFRAFFEMRVERERLDRDQQSLTRVLARPDSGISPVQLEAIASVRESAELSRALADLTTREAEARAMRLQFTEQHPPLQRLDAEIAELRRQTIPALARQLAAQLASRVRDTDTRIGRRRGRSSRSRPAPSRRRGCGATSPSRRTSTPPSSSATRRRASRK